MDVAKTSMALSQAKLQMDVNLSTMNKSKQFAEQTGELFLEMVEKSVPPHPTLGKHVDISG